MQIQQVPGKNEGGENNKKPKEEGRKGKKKSRYASLE